MGAEMRDFWDNAPLLAITAVAALVFFGMGKLIFADLERGQVRYEQCIAADKQWVQGSCVK
jgi:hypothetical protein